MNNELLLLSGADIPFPKARITIHQPSCFEISYLGEETFQVGCNILRFTKDMLSKEDQIKLAQKSDFDIMMQIINSKNQDAESAKMVLNLIFPNYTIAYLPQSINFFQEEQLCGSLFDTSYNEFRQILDEMFCFKQNKDQQYNPHGKLANEIAEKLKQGRQKVAKLKGNKDKIAIFSRYLSILAVGLKLDLNIIMKYTVYQMYDQYKRYSHKAAFDAYYDARIAGATGMKEPEDWQKDLYDEK